MVMNMSMRTLSKDYLVLIDLIHECVTENTLKRLPSTCIDLFHIEQYDVSMLYR